MSRFLFTDTSFWYGLFVTHDQHHADSQRLWAACVKKHITPVTSNLIVSELGTLLVYNFGHETALKRINIILDSALLTRIYVDRDIETGALAWWRKFADQSFSFPDCVSFELMRRTGIRQVLSFDCDFSVAGFENVRSEHQI